MQRHFRLSVIVTGATSLPSLGDRHWCNVTSVSRSSSLGIRHFRLSVIVTAYGLITMHGATPFSVSPVVSGATLCSSSLGHSVSDAVHLFGLQSVEQLYPMSLDHVQWCKSGVSAIPSVVKIHRPFISVNCATLSSFGLRH